MGMLSFPSYIEFFGVTGLWFPPILLHSVLQNCYYHYYFFVLLGLQLRHMEVHRLGIKSELQLLAYTTATATDPDPRHLRPTPQLMGNAGSLTHRARPGIEPASSWV